MTEDYAQEMRVALMELAENVKPIMEAVEGYREELDRAGYGDGLVRKMAADYHASLLRMCFK